jgi:uncharacterized protein YggE
LKYGGVPALIPGRSSRLFIEEVLMKNIILTLTILSLILPAAFAEDEKHYITVNGTAEIKVVPDRLTFSLGVNKRVRNLSSARDEMDKVIKDAIAFCKKNGVKDKDIQTSHVNISPYYDYSSKQERHTLAYYELNQTLTVTLDDISKYESLIYPLLDLGINEVNSVVFSTSKLRQHRDEARVAAVKAAQEKAKLLTDAAGIKLGKPVNITESTNQYRPYYYERKTQTQNVTIDAGGYEPESFGISSGMVSISAGVDITYEVQ